MQSLTTDSSRATYNEEPFPFEADKRLVSHDEFVVRAMQECGAKRSAYAANGHSLQRSRPLGAAGIRLE
jgi:hypothetical protein